MTEKNYQLTFEETQTLFVLNTFQYETYQYNKIIITYNNKDLHVTFIHVDEDYGEYAYYLATIKDLIHSDLEKIGDDPLIYFKINSRGLILSVEEPRPIKTITYLQRVEEDLQRVEREFYLEDSQCEKIQELINLVGQDVEVIDHQSKNLR